MPTKDIAHILEGNPVDPNHRVVNAELRLWLQEVYVPHDSLTDLISSTILARGEGAIWYAAGAPYEEANSGATDHHLVTDAGVKLYDLTPLHEAGSLRQRHQYEPFAGFDDGATDDQIFPGSRLPPQGICRLTVSGKEYDFVALQDDSGGASPELYRIVQYEVGTAAHVTSSGILALSHVQDLSGSVSGSTVTLYCQADDGTDDGKGISVIAWDGASTEQADVTTYQLFGSVGSGHRYERFKDATVGVNGDRVVLLANDTKTEVDDTGHSLFVYSLAEILAAGDPLDVEPKVGPLPIPIGTNAGQHTLQGCDLHEDHFRLLRGFVNPRQRKAIQFFDYRGNLLRTVEVALGLNDYTQAQLGDDGTLETLITIEPEGLTSDALGRAIIVAQEEWHETGDVVSWEGKNFTPRRSAVTSAPSEDDDWVETTATASGAWSAGTYNWGTNYTRRAKTIHVIDKPLASGADDPLGNAAWFDASNATIKGGANSVDIGLPLLKDFLVATLLGVVSKTRRLFGYYSEFSMRLFDAREGSDNDLYGNLFFDGSDGGEFGFRVNGGITEGAGISLLSKNHSVFPGRLRAWGAKVDGTAVRAFDFDAENDIWDRLRRIPWAVGASGVKYSHTGDTLETPLLTVTVPGGLLGPNGYLRIRFQTEQTNNANNKTLKIKMDGNEIVNTTGSMTGSAGTSRIVQVHNRDNDEAKQKTMGATAAADPSETSVPATYLTVDTSQPFDIVFTAQLADAGDELALGAYSIEACYVP